MNMAEPLRLSTANGSQTSSGGSNNSTSKLLLRQEHTASSQLHAANIMVETDDEEDDDGEEGCTYDRSNMMLEPGEMGNSRQVPLSGSSKILLLRRPRLHGAETFEVQQAVYVERDIVSVATEEEEIKAIPSEKPVEPKTVPLPTNIAMSPVYNTKSNAPRDPVLTLEQRELAYEEARRRIFGNSACDVSDTLLNNKDIASFTPPTYTPVGQPRPLRPRAFRPVTTSQFSLTSSTVTSPGPNPYFYNVDPYMTNNIQQFHHSRLTPAPSQNFYPHSPVINQQQFTGVGYSLFPGESIENGASVSMTSSSTSMGLMGQHTYPYGSNNFSVISQPNVFPPPPPPVFSPVNELYPSVMNRYLPTGSVVPDIPVNNSLGPNLLNANRSNYVVSSMPRLSGDSFIHMIPPPPTSQTETGNASIFGTSETLKSENQPPLSSIIQSGNHNNYDTDFPPLGF